MESLDLDMAGDFLVMAATLCFLKSREQRPQLHADDGALDMEAEQIREDLGRRLLEYQRYRNAAEELSERAMLGRDVYAPVPEPLDPNERPVDPGVDSIGLLNIFYGLLQRQAEPEPVHRVERATYSLEIMAGWVVDTLANGPRALADLLHSFEHRADRVVMFLASLELAKLQMLDIQQDRHLGPVVLTSRVAAEGADLSVLSEGA
jgi:segregation and condensation protein A